MADSLSDWIYQRMIRGKYFFTKEDVLLAGLHQTNDSLKTALSRAASKGIIVSVWQNFYVVVPTEYRLRGEVPPSFYIDQLMKYLRRNYYVSGLSAAALRGASHQRAMVFQVTVDGGPIRSSVKNGTRLEFTLRNTLPEGFVGQVKTKTGYMNVSSPELTALDIVAGEQKIGGLSRAAEVLSELCESMRWDETKLPLLDAFSMAVIQRLGYLLEKVGEQNFADSLHSLVLSGKRIMRLAPLKQSATISDDMAVDSRWKIIENYELDIDEI